MTSQQGEGPSPAGGDPADPEVIEDPGQTADLKPGTVAPRAHSYGTRDVQPGYETQPAAPAPVRDPRRATRHDVPRDARDEWGADENSD